MPTYRAADSGLAWRKALRSVGNGACVEVARDEGVVLVRDSKDPEGPALAWRDAQWRAFVRGAKGGRFDQLG